MSDGPTIRLERDGAVASIILSNSPLNLFTGSSWDEPLDRVRQGR